MDPDTAKITKACIDIAKRKSRLEEFNRGLKVVSTVLQRYLKTSDPVLRYTLLMDKFLILCEVGMSYATTGLSSHDDLINDHGKTITEAEEFKKLLIMEEEVKKNVNDTMDLTKGELYRLMDWIQQSKMSPDSVAGENLMKSAQQDFDSHRHQQSAEENISYEIDD